jgi:hypothetical protein
MMDNFESLETEKLQNFSLLIQEIITKYFVICHGREILDFLTSEPILKKLFESVLEEGYCSLISLEILAQIAGYYVYTTNLHTDYPEDSEYYIIMRDKYEEMPFVQLFCTFLPQFT